MEQAINILKTVRANYQAHELIEKNLEDDDLQTLFCSNEIDKDSDFNISDNIFTAYYLILAFKKNPQFFKSRYRVLVDTDDMSGRLKVRISECSPSKTLNAIKSRAYSDYIVELSFKTLDEHRKRNVEELIKDLFYIINDNNIDTDKIKEFTKYPTELISTLFSIFIETENFEVFSCDNYDFKRVKLITHFKHLFEIKFPDLFTFQKLEQIQFSNKELMFFKEYSISINIECFDKYGNENFQRKEVVIWFDEQENCFKEDTTYSGKHLNSYKIQEESVNKFILECYKNGLYSLTISATENEDL